MHVCDGGFGVDGVRVNDVGCSTVRHDWVGTVSEASGNGQERRWRHALPVHGKVYASDWTAGAEYLAKVVLVDVLCEFLYHDLMTC